MSLTDTAEYWWDIKNKPYKHTFVHLKGINCGHFHVVESNDIDIIDCKACNKILSEDKELKDKLVLQKKKQEENKLKQIKANWINKYPNNPICTCGFPMLERTNNLTKSKFWGCSQYPNCNHTKTI